MCHYRIRYQKDAGDGQEVEDEYRSGADVEKLLGFCTAAEHEELRRSVLPFERMLARSGTQLFKSYLDISKFE